ncbi:MAG: hypothetical protein A2Y62_16070 [Candidatus Fischerbacteria bacterium RBG_13_37_8]|uniref:Uncharacterized protein n=1 Tax=Candidatus Fischerbacteria bacterium RBG_13_37_8 TaxID=1817863 RepID=A0A1F5VXV5_9BACT|nr:MAG: hypothetical protein A2Y62_16070 [Candidatus Fischerbacteria bacterium RBG_13_37_8]
MVEGQIFHSRLSISTLISSSEAAPSNINGPAKRTNNPGLLANPAKIFLILVLEAGAGSNAERKEYEITLATMITIERIIVARRSENNLPGLKLRSRRFSPQRNRRSSHAITIDSGAITAR